MPDNRKLKGFRYFQGKSGNSPKPLEGQLATGYNGSINSGSAIDVEVGTPVRKLDSGYFEVADGSEGGSGGETIDGIVVGIKQYWNGSKLVSGSRIPNSTAYSTILERTSIFYYLPAESCYWEVDADDAATATTEAAWRALRGSNADHILTTGSEPDANVMLDISSNTDASPGAAQWRIIDLSPTRENRFLDGLYVKLIVEINESAAAWSSVTGL